MNRRFWIIGGLALVIVAVIVVFLVVRPTGDQEHPATILEAINKVDAHPQPQDDWQPAFVDMLIYGGGQVRTGTASSARLELANGMVRLAADSVFTVKKSVTSQDELITTLFLKEGRLWAHLTPDQRHELSVETGNAVAAVRDTRFSVRATADETLVSVAEGEVALTAQDQTVTVVAEQQATVRSGAPPSPPVPLSDVERALWATEGEMPALAPPTPAPTPTSARVEMWADVYCGLTGPAGAPLTRDPTTAFDVVVENPDAAQISVETPDGETVLIPPYGDIYGRDRRFHARIAGLPQASRTYRFTALDTDGKPIPGAVANDVYIGGHGPDPPTNVQAELTESGLLVTWDPSRKIPGAFDPSASPPLGFYQISLGSPETGTAYGWHHVGDPLRETSHLAPFRRGDFGRGDKGASLEELEDGEYHLAVEAFSVTPPDTAGQGIECGVHDPNEGIRIVIEGGQVRVEEP